MDAVSGRSEGMSEDDRMIITPLDLLSFIFFAFFSVLSFVLFHPYMF